MAVKIERALTGDSAKDLSIVSYAATEVAGYPPEKSFTYNIPTLVHGVKKNKADMLSYIQLIPNVSSTVDAAVAFSLGRPMR